MTNVRDLSDRARDSRESGNPNDAGDWFTTVAYNYLGREPFWDHPHTVFRMGLKLSQAVLCYRLGDQRGRALNRAKQGQLVTEEAFDRISEHSDPPQLHLYRATLLEYAGDLRVYSGQAERPEEFATAIDQYRRAAKADGRDAYHLIDCEERNEYSIDLFNALIKLTEAPVEEVYSFDDETTHVEWVEYKRRHLPELVDRLLDAGIEVYRD